MGMSGAAGALLAGVIVAFGSYGLLCLLAALLVIPLAASVLRRVAAPVPSSAD
jgi:hypothetical protein